ncbi:MAG: hypothetical protein AUG04_10955 [Deltaproteobacteria bacterium 13_1_20CM_2_69_21]|nr:MAG: hypothetical protein AUG04_10955 [Deltaproteobacteria bacterium 13_1_20CM_2_69_21]
MQLKGRSFFRLSPSRLAGGYFALCVLVLALFALIVGRESARFRSLVDLFWYGIAGATVIALAIGALVGWMIHRQNAQLADEISVRQRAEQALHRAQEGLEAVVAERTAQLAEAFHEVESQKRLRHGAAPGLPFAFIRAIDGSPAYPDGGPCGMAVSQNEQVIAADLESDSRWDIEPAQSTAHSPTNVAVPAEVAGAT